MSGSVRKAAMAVLLFSLFCGPSEAMPGRIGRSVLPLLPEAGRLNDGDFTVGPRAFQTFCATYPDQCSASAPLEEVRLDEAHWSMLEEINISVNHRIVAQSDPDGTDTWTLDVAAGDCDDYAVEKRKELIDRGWPITALSLAVARIRSGEAHLVLTVRTDRGDFVLDNLRDRVRPVQQVGYRWMARQSSLHPRLWVGIDGIERTKMRDDIAKRNDEGRTPAHPVVATARVTPTTPETELKQKVGDLPKSEKTATSRIALHAPQESSPNPVERDDAAQPDDKATETGSSDRL